MMKKYLNSFFYLIAAFVFTDLFSQHASAQIRLEVESASAWQIRNVNRVPADGGTEFDLARFSRGPIFAPRYLLTWDVDSKHSIRAMIFPFQTSGSGEFSKDVVFNNTTFAAGSPTTGTYKFHSYRLTYRYVFLDSGHWQLRGSFPGEVGLVPENNSVREFPAAIPNQSLDEGMTPRYATDRFYFLDLVVLG